MEEIKRKNSFVMYTDWGPAFKGLTDEEAGLLIKNIFSFVLGENEERTGNQMVDYAFSFIKPVMIKDAEKYKEKCQKRQEAINKRWGNNSKQEDTSVNSCNHNNTNEYNSIQMNTNEYNLIQMDTDNDNDNENENENVNENDNGINKHDNNIKESGAKRFCPPTLEEVRAYCQERGNKIDPEAFISYYDSIGWVVGKTKMKKWKQAIITWERRQKEKENEKAAVNASSDQADNDAKIRECYVSTINGYPLDTKNDEGWDTFKRLTEGNWRIAMKLSGKVSEMVYQSFEGKYQLQGLEKDLEVAYGYIQH